MKSSNYIFALLTLLLFSLNTLAADPQQSKLEYANSLYDAGECEKAITAYQNLKDSDIDQNQKDNVLFKTSYCHFSLGHYHDSELGFKSYLNLHPTEDEAWLKYAQSFLFQNKYNLAQKAAQKVKSPDFIADAAIVIARTQIEASEYNKATNTLTPYADNPEAAYWMGVAYYQDDSDTQAEQKFTLAEQKASTNSWVKSEAKAWLNRINEDKNKFHMQLTLGGFNDSNIDQSGASATLNPTGAGGPPKPSFTNNNYTSDTGSYASVDFIHNTYSSRKLYLTTTVNALSPFYTKNQSYNQESASLDFSLKAISSNTFNYGVSLKYQDTWYNGYYSQDYIYLTPSTSWSFAADYWLKFSVPVTAYLNGKKIYIYGPNLDLYYDATNWLSLSLGLSYLKSTGPEAVIAQAAPDPVLVSGTMFSHYATTGAYLGLTFNITDTWQFGITGSNYQTNYEMEKLPGPGEKPNPRSDTMKVYQATLSKTFIKNVWSAHLSHSYTDNKSNGFQGLASSGSITSNTYTRGYTLLSTVLYY